MSAISKVCYLEIPEDECSVDKASEFYFYQNVMGLDKNLDDEFVEYETNQSHIRSKAIRDYMTETGDKVDLSSTIYGTSTMKNSTILVAKIK